MKKIILWIFRKLIKNKSVIELIERQRRSEAIGYNLWVGSLNKHGFPKNDNGSFKDCWQLYDYYFKSDNRNIYIQHSEKK